MRILRVALLVALVCLMMTEPLAAALPRLGVLATDENVTAANGVSTHVMIDLTLTNEEAAQRLYFLGLISGVGVQNGAVDFALEQPLSRLEAIVMTARLLGVESEVLQENNPHPFNDVPTWGSPYVGYFWQNGLIEMTDTGNFEPDATVSTNYFMKNMFYALGYTEDNESYIASRAALYAVQSGICTETKSALTRGDAAQILFRTLNASCAGTENTLSYYLVENEYLGYEDALFLLWSESAEESTAYIAQKGYTTEKILPDGKYTVVLKGSTRCLNVAVDGGNSDYEGVGVTIWQRTDDISQKFRIERTDSGSYRVYSCASGGGFQRMLGIGAYGTAGLYSANSAYVGEYYIRCTDSGDCWQFISAADPSRVLGSDDRRNGSSVTLVTAGDPAYKTEWTFEFDGVVNEEGYEYAIYPSDTLCITQGAYDVYSHQRQNALDISTTNGSVYAPFTGKIVRIDRGYSKFNTVWLESCDKVIYADGSVDYMTVVFMHDNNVADLSVGQIVAQGEYFYQMGVAGGATGPHVHIAVIRGQYSSSMSLTGSGDVYVEDALFVPTDTSVILSYGLDWVYMNP